MNNILQRLNEVIQVEATTTSVGDFLITHKPFQNLYQFVKNEEMSSEPIDEEFLFNEIFRENIQNHQFVVIQGTQGCGKSHIIRWMKFKLEQEIDKNKEAVMFISRNHNTLQDAIQQILDSDIFPENIKNTQIKKLKENSSGGLSGKALKKQIILNLELSIDDDDEKEDVILDRRMRDMLKVFLKDDYIADKFLMPDGSPIDRIRLRMENSEGDHVNFDEGDIFTNENLKLDYKDINNLQDSNIKAKRFAEKLVASVGAETLKNKVIRYLNSKVSSVIEKSERFKTTDLKALFDSLRIELKREGKNLILFIEDLTAFTGLDKAMVEVLVADHRAEGNENYCRLISIVGLTRAFYEDNIPNNLRDRITENILINTGDSGELKSTFFQNPKELAKFAAKYINAINLSRDAVEQWVKRGADLSNIPIYEDNLKHEWANVDDNGRIYSIYPFNENALWNLYFSIDEKDRTPRALLKDVIKSILGRWAVEGKALIRNERAFDNGIIRIPAWSNIKHYDQDCENYNEQDRIPRQILLRVWGNQTTEKINGKVGDVDKEIFEEFEVSTDIFSKTEVKSMPVAPVVAPTKTVVNASTVLTTEEKKYNDLFNEITEWQKDPQNELLSHIELRELLCHKIINTIDWSRYDVPRQFLEYFSFKNVYIEGQVLRPGSKYIYTVHRSPETKYALIALIGFKYKGGNSWDYENSLDDYINFITWLKTEEKNIADFLKAQRETEVDFPFIYIASEFYLKTLLGEIDANASTDKIIESLIKSPKNGIEQFKNKLHSSYWTQTFEFFENKFDFEMLHSANMNYFKRLFGDPTTDTVSYNLYDLELIVRQIKKLQDIHFDLNLINTEQGTEYVKNYLLPLEFLQELKKKISKLISEGKDTVKQYTLPIFAAIGTELSNDTVHEVLVQMQDFLNYLDNVLQIPYPKEAFYELPSWINRSAEIYSCLELCKSLQTQNDSIENLKILTRLDFYFIQTTQKLFGEFHKLLTEKELAFRNENGKGESNQLESIQNKISNELDDMLSILEERNL